MPRGEKDASGVKRKPGSLSQLCDTRAHAPAAFTAVCLVAPAVVSVEWRPSRIAVTSAAGPERRCRGRPSVPFERSDIDHCPMGPQPQLARAHFQQQDRPSRSRNRRLEQQCSGRGWNQASLGFPTAVSLSAKTELWLVRCREILASGYSLADLGDRRRLQHQRSVPARAWCPGGPPVVEQQVRPRSTQMISRGSAGGPAPIIAMSFHSENRF